MSWVETYYYSISQFSYPENKESLFSVLDEYERSRFERFAFDHLKWTFATARWILKTKIAEKSACHAANVILHYSENGKPFVNKKHNIEFSVSHTNKGIAIALSNKAVGVDLELHQRRGEPWKNAESFLNSNVEKKLATFSSDEQKIRSFSRYWTAMESLVKLRGSTLFREKETFDQGLKLMDQDGEYSCTDHYWYTQEIDSEAQLTLCLKNKADKLEYKVFDGKKFVSSNLFSGQ